MGAPSRDDEAADWVGREAEEHFGLASTAAADDRLARAVLALS